jgi:hypothetical protein
VDGSLTGRGSAPTGEARRQPSAGVEPDRTGPSVCYVVHDQGSAEIRFERDTVTQLLTIEGKAGLGDHKYRQEKESRRRFIAARERGCPRSCSSMFSSLLGCGCRIHGSGLRRRRSDGSVGGNRGTGGTEDPTLAVRGSSDGAWILSRSFR